MVLNLFEANFFPYRGRIATCMGDIPNARSLNECTRERERERERSGVEERSYNK